MYARNILLFSKREAARAGIVLPKSDARAQHIQTHLKLERGDVVRVGVVNGLKVCNSASQGLPRPGCVAMILQMRPFPAGATAVPSTACDEWQQLRLFLPDAHVLHGSKPFPAKPLHNRTRQLDTASRPKPGRVGRLS